MKTRRHKGRGLLNWTAYVVAFCSALILLPCDAKSQKGKAEQQKDTTEPKTKNGLFSQLVQAFSTDTLTDLTYSEGVVRNDAPFQRYKGKRIRNIIISRFDVGRTFQDTTKAINNFLLNTARKLHTTTRDQVVRKNLFFHEGDVVMPYLLADNERHLREQVFLNDARIVLRTVKQRPDLVDAIVITRDVLSIGGEVSLHGNQSFEILAKEENLHGTGNSIWGGFFYDGERKNNTGYRAEYRQRNINGTFIDVHGGFTTYGVSFSNGKREEDHIFAGLVKPLVSAYDSWTYAFEFGYHHTKNRYSPDSVFKSDLQYQYHNYDVWGGYLINGKKAIGKLNDNRWRQFAGLRLFTQKFREVPGIYKGNYHFMYADVKGVLGSFSIFKQEFYRTRYIYGFGRNEDVPEGSDVSLIMGFTNKENRERSYFGLDFRRYYFTRRNHYFDFTARYGSFLYNEAFEDISVLFNVDFISRLRTMRTGWKQRFFLNAGIAKEFRTRLNTPLFLESKYGLPMMTNGTVAADTRVTLRAETLFFNDSWNLIGFHFAPIAGAGLSLLKPANGSFGQSDIFTVLTTGLRIRNENLVFGTVEAKAHYFPNVQHQTSAFLIELSTNLQFRYLSQFIRKPDFIQLN